MTKSATTAYIGIGSNLSNPLDQVTHAVTAINEIANISVSVASSLYASKPMGPQDQPDYVNAVIEISTELEPLLLLDALQKIELESGRVRKDERWGPRTLDLDIILFGNHIIESERLTVPHCGMRVREFVLFPLLEIASELTLPNGDSLIDLCNNIDQNGLFKQHKIKWIQ